MGVNVLARLLVRPRVSVILTLVRSDRVEMVVGIAADIMSVLVPMIVETVIVEIVAMQAMRPMGVNVERVENRCIAV